MSSTAMNAIAQRFRDESDVVILEVVRLVSADAWTSDRAARTLLAKRHTRAALRLAQARVLRVRAESASRIAERAAATLRMTLAMHDGPAVSGR
jgi:hypothetical protein